MILAGTREPTWKITDNGCGMKVEWMSTEEEMTKLLTRLNDWFDSTFIYGQDGERTYVRHDKPRGSERSRGVLTTPTVALCRRARPAGIGAVELRRRQSAPA